MNDDLQRAYDRLGDAAAPPFDARERVAARVVQRRRRRTAAFAACAVVAAVSAGSVAALVSRPGTGGDDGAAAGAPREVACSQGRVLETPALDEVRVPAFETPIEAALAWAGPGAGALEVSADERYGYLLGDDGSVRARMNLRSTRVDLEDREPTSWYVDGSAACSDEASSLPWDPADALACAGGVVRARVTYPAAGDRRALTADEAVERMLTGRGDTSSLALTEGSRSGDVTGIIRTDSTRHTAVRVVRVADTWRVAQVAACPDRLPGLPRTDVEVTAVPLFVGKCQIVPLEYSGTIWQAPDDEQFGTGGGLPETWRGWGTVTPTGETLIYTDIGGTKLTLLPAGSPGVSEQDFCA